MVRIHFGGPLLAIRILRSVKRFHHQIIFSLAGGNPVHAMRARLMLQANRRPISTAIGCGVQVKNGAGLCAIIGFTNIPLATHGDLSFAVTIDIPGRHAYVIPLGQFPADLMLLP